MQLHNLTTSKKNSQRIGRGGKRGTTSGRGTKGQRSRSGHKIRPALRDLISRLPKKRGFKNKPKSEPTFVVNLSAVERHLAKHKGEAVVSRATLVAWGIIPRRYVGAIKVLATGVLKTPITLKGVTVSKAAQAKIEKAGGTVQGSKVE